MKALVKSYPLPPGLRLSVGGQIEDQEEVAGQVRWAGRTLAASTSTLLTLVVVPVIYTYLDALERRRKHSSRSSPRAAL